MIILSGLWVAFLLSLGCSRGSAERKLIFNSGAGNIQIVEVLLERKTNPNAADSTGTTPLLASAANGHLEIVKLLLEKGADPHLKDKEGRSALEMAEAAGFTQIAAILKEYKAEKNEPIRNGGN